MLSVFMYYAIEDKSTLIESVKTVYTTEGSTSILTFPINKETIKCRLGSSRHPNFGINQNDNRKYQIRINDLKLQIYNITKGDEGIYWTNSQRGLHVCCRYVQLKISNGSCSNLTSETTCTNEGSSAMLIFIYDLDLYHNNKKMDITKLANKRILDNFTINLQINNITAEDEGFYECTAISSRLYMIRQNAAKIRFIHQFNTRTILAQEGKETTIICFSDSGQYITELQLDANGTTIATGDNHTVFFSFAPDRTHHLTTYTCIDSKRPSINTNALLRVNYSPDINIRITGELIDCECDGVPKVYNPYRLDHLSEFGELIHSVNLNNEKFILHHKSYQYQYNGEYRCTVSNGIPVVSGQVIQIKSKTVKYEGPPVFALENRNAKFWEQGQSFTMTFKVYSNPTVKNVFIYKLGHKQTEANEITNYTVLNSTLLYTEVDLAGIKGYAIVIDREVLVNDDFQSYRITVSNQLGASDYHFEIINVANLPVSREKMAYFILSCCVTGVLLITVAFVFTCSCVTRQKTKTRRELTTSEARSSYTYDYALSVSYQATGNSVTVNTNRNPVQSSTLPCKSSMSNDLDPNIYQNIEKNN
ncbi:unnamed protein product [Mytilus edulis]|uniref:Immunoglobulin domain-containing protein n=1 Tax=Mytilus edulis TaxID=6550 RepID=A0A8S3TG24_MYTED|nr:unnamed protein product [Mytilus edulis]